MSRASKLIHESSSSRLERWSSDGAFCQVDVRFHTDDVLRESGPLKSFRK